MIYSFGIKSDEALYLEIDSVAVLLQLKEYFDKEDFEDLSLKIKNIVKTPNDFYKLCEDFSIEDREMFSILNNIFPDIFNKRMLTSLHRIYTIKGGKRKKYENSTNT